MDHIPLKSTSGDCPINSRFHQLSMLSQELELFTFMSIYEAALLRQTQLLEASKYQITLYTSLIKNALKVSYS